jgi:glycosyltransferase involved in cell wall biosynthesis
MKNPKVSVVIPAYNHEKYVGEAIQSVLDQTFQDFEIIIINDGSTDHTEAEILKFKGDRIRYYSQENQGLSATLNRGIKLARGEYFNFLPSDDIFFPNKLEIQLKAFEEDPALGLVFAYPELVDAEGREIKDDPAVQWAIVPYETKEEIFPALFERDFLSAPTALIKMECFNRVGRFDESLKTAQDYDLWMRILKYYDLKIVKRTLLKYRWHGENLTYRPTSETELERSKVLVKAYKDLSIDDIFPSLRATRDSFAYAEAYETLASYMEKSGIPALIPISQIYRDKGKSLFGSHLDLSPHQEEESSKRFGFMPFNESDRRIRILIETPSLDKGGMEEAIYAIATHLDLALFSPIVVCIERGGYTADRLKKSGVPVEILGKEKEKEYLEILRRYQIDLVNSHYSFFGSKIVQQYGIPVVSVLHNLYGWYTGGILDEFRIVDQYVSGYVAVSKQVASFFKYRFNIDPKKIQIIPDGIDLKQFEEKSIQKKLDRKVLGFDEEDFIFLHVGAITPAKMQNLLVAVMKEISINYPKIKLISLGPVLDKEYSSFIQRKTEEHHLDQCLKFIGFAENLSLYYRLADAFVLPSLVEGWGIATLEAMFHSLPLILTKVGGAEELVENQDIGILIKNCCEDLFQLSGSDMEYFAHLDRPNNTNELIEAMLNIYKNRDAWREKAKEGRRKVISYYTWDQIIPQYETKFISLTLARERKKRLLLERVVRDQKRRIDEPIKRMKELENKFDQQRKEMREGLMLTNSQFQQHFVSINEQLDYILTRLSFTERIKERIFNLLKTIHRLVPKKIREKYRFQYRRFFFDKVFSDKKRVEQFIPSLNHPDILSGEEVEQFLEFVQKCDFKKLFAIYTTDPYMESRGQRSTWLAKEFARRGFPVVFFYWRWDQKEEIVKSLDSHILSVPIDEFSKIEKRLFPFTSDRLKKVFLIEFPDSSLFEKVNIANVNSFLTIYDCIDNWEEFDRKGQAVWYDIDVERYLLQNVDLVVATHPILAEKLKQMGATDVPIIPNGVDIASLQQKQGIMENIEKGVLTVGYFGHLTESWFDWDLVLKTALKRKDWFFHIIGYGEPSGLKFPENVKFWGKVEHEDLPSYTHSWDVAIIPFKEGKLAEAVDPIKLYEYLYLSLPVVATNMPHLQGVPGAFPCCRDDFEKTLILAKETSLDHGEVERFIQNSTWEKRVNRFLEEIDRIDLSRNILKGIG